MDEFSLGFTCYLDCGHDVDVDRMCPQDPPFIGQEMLCAQCGGVRRRITGTTPRSFNQEWIETPAGDVGIFYMNTPEWGYHLPDEGVEVRGFATFEEAKQAALERFSR